MIVEVIIAFLIFLCVLTRKSKIVFLLFAGLMLLLMVFETDNADYTAYFGRYMALFDSSQILNTDLGFGFLMYFCKKLGLSYEEFLGVISFLGLCMAYYVYNKYSVISCIHLVVYFLLMYNQHIIQIRSFLAEWIIVIAVLYFLKEKAKIVNYVFLVFIASIFHFTSLFYLLLVIPKYIKNTYKICIAVGLATFTFPSLYGILQSFSSISTIMRFEIYLRGANERFSMFSLLFIALLMILTFLTAYLSHKCFGKGDVETGVIFRLITNFNIITWISLGLIITFSNNFYRLNRPMILVSLLYMINYFFERKDMLFIKRAVFFSGIFVLLFIVSELVLPYKWSWYGVIHFNSLFQYFNLI